VNDGAAGGGLLLRNAAGGLENDAPPLLEEPPKLACEGAGLWTGAGALGGGPLLCGAEFPLEPAWAPLPWSAAFASPIHRANVRLIAETAALLIRFMVQASF
jgi:hypothetical protein